MSGIDYLLSGIEAELALERELGNTVFACDRALVQVEKGPGDSGAGGAGTGGAGTGGRGTLAASSAKQRPSIDAAGVPRPPEPRPQVPRPQVPRPLDGLSSYVFLHHKALSAGGVEMMAKIVTAMGATAETAPILFTGELPRAKVYVVLGSLALRKWFPGLAGAPGQWIATPTTPNILVTYSPEYILRFAAGGVTPALKKIKLDMWTSLKGAMQRARVTL